MISAPSKFLAAFAFIAFSILIHSGSISATETNGFDARAPISYQDGCHLPYLEFQPKPCFYGDLQSKFTVYLIGDSHAAQWLPGLIQLAEQKKWRVRSMTKSGCPAAFLPMFSQCLTWNEAIIKEVAEQKPQLIFLGNLTNSQHKLEKGQRSYYVSFKIGFSNMVEHLSKYSRVKIIEDTPYPDFDIENCVRTKGLGKCGFRETNSNISSLTKLIARKHKADYLLTKELFCRGEYCIDSKNGVNLYRDGSHISGSASKLFSEIFNR